MSVKTHIAVYLYKVGVDVICSSGVASEQFDTSVIICKSDSFQWHGEDVAQNSSDNDGMNKIRTTLLLLLLPEGRNCRFDEG